MFTLFRKIRHNLIDQNKLGRYSLYAVGETLLIIVGILIALSFDAWVDEQADIKLEAKILSEIQENLVYDMAELDRDLELMVIINDAAEYIHNHIDSHPAPQADFATYAGHLRITPHFNPNTSGYQLLLSKGLEIIRNDEIRMAMTRLYSSSYPYYQRYEDERIQFRLLHFEPLAIKYFRRNFDSQRSLFIELRISQEDYELLLQDKTFHNFLDALQSENEAVRVRGQTIRQDQQQLADKITAYLDQS